MSDSDHFSSQLYQQRLARRSQSPHQAIWDLLDQVKDPEIPVISLWDLGVLCDIDQAGEQVIISITPTYSGCPALDIMRQDIEITLHRAGIESFEIRQQLSPAWNTDWLSPAGRLAMQQYGIAPPQCAGGEQQPVICPHCQSRHTQLVSQFASTACKALYRCDDCLEAFDYFKCL